ncbi:MAG: hypothetical protein ABR507_07450 [Actinomycetota bacterium]
MAFKGFDSDSIDATTIEAVASVDHEAVFVDDEGLDITAYIKVASGLGDERLVFMNSFSEILTDGWLGSFDSCFTQTGVGIVGATGSWESVFEDQFYLPPVTGRGIVRDMKSRYLRKANRIWFPPFPNPHIRTNAFMIARADFLDASAGVGSKFDAARFESGRQGLTRLIMASGKTPLVVGADGRCYQTSEWPASKTFRAAEQSNLMVADNRTRDYESADSETKELLRLLAWGPPTREAP